jgi:hypothetical protein
VLAEKTALFTVDLEPGVENRGESPASTARRFNEFNDPPGVAEA